MMPGLVMTTDHDDMMIASNDVLFVRLFGLGLALSCFIIQKLGIPVYMALNQTNRQNHYVNQHRIYNCIVSEYSPRPPFPFPRISAG